MALLRRAKFMVSADTGPLHLAAALGAPVVGFSVPPTPRATAPIGDDGISVRNPRNSETTYRRGNVLFFRHAFHYSRAGNRRHRAPERNARLNEAVAVQPRKFWMRWRVRTGYPVAVIYWLLASPTPRWIAIGAVVAALGLLVRAHCCRAPAQRQGTGYHRSLRAHAQPALSRQRVSRRRVCYCRTFLVGGQPGARLFRGLLLRGHAQRGARSPRAFRRPLRRICRARSAVFSAIFSMRASPTPRKARRNRHSPGRNTAATVNTRP